MGKSKIFLATASALFFLSIASSVLAAQGVEESLRKRFMDEPFVDGKAAVALKLAALRTKASRETLMGLFASEDSWNAAGAFPGLFALGDPAADEILAKRYLGDAGIRSFVSKYLAEKPERFLPHFRKAYESDAEGSLRPQIIEAVALGNGSGTEAFLTAIIDDQSSPWREEAYDAYSFLRRKGDAERARFLVRDAGLKDRALARLAVIGKSDDIGIFMAEFYADPRPQIRIPSMKAISSWGDKDAKRKVFASALSGADPSTAEAAFGFFAAVRSEGLMLEAGKIADSEISPFARLAAGEYLAGYGTEEAIALAVPSFKAAYSADAKLSGFGDWMAHVITLGLSTLLEGIEKARSAKDFQKRKDDLAGTLSTLAGKRMPADFPVWEAWCLSRGLSVGGRNLIQELLSSDQGARKEATRSAFGLLGFRNEAAFQAAHPEYASADDFGKLLYLAQALREKGYPKAWR